MSKYILVAEDDQLLRKLYGINLQASGRELEIAENGELAIRAIEKRQPDLLLLDLLMPIVDGFGVLKFIQQKAYKFPVIVLSNLAQDVDMKKCLELGAKDFFVKGDMDLWKLADIVKMGLGETGETDAKTAAV
ncbi:MAG: response regulator [Candidatus Peribacteraceae bacterium]|nr:response regulator [Candidatus Peribacteraceae bacterium]